MSFFYYRADPWCAVWSNSVMSWKDQMLQSWCKPHPTSQILNLLWILVYSLENCCDTWSSGTGTDRKRSFGEYYNSRVFYVCSSFSDFDSINGEDTGTAYAHRLTAHSTTTSRQFPSSRQQQMSWSKAGSNLNTKSSRIIAGLTTWQTSSSSSGWLPSCSSAGFQRLFFFFIAHRWVKKFLFCWILVAFLSTSDMWKR